MSHDKNMQKCMSYSYKQLKQILKDENIPLRTSLKTKHQMCDVLVYTDYFDEEDDINVLSKMLDKTSINSNVEFNTIPSIVLHDIVDKITNPRDFINFCSVNTSMKKLYNNDILWKLLFQTKYKRAVKMQDISWREMYMDFHEYPYEIVVPTDDIHKSGIFERGTISPNHEIQVIKAKQYKDKCLKRKADSYRYMVRYNLEDNTKTILNIVFCNNVDARAYENSAVVKKMIGFRHSHNFIDNCLSETHIMLDDKSWK